MVVVDLGVFVVVCSDSILGESRRYFCNVKRSCIVGCEGDCTVESI